MYEHWKCFLFTLFFCNQQVPSNDVSTVHYEVLSIDTSGELDRNRLNLTLNLANFIRSSSITSIDIDTLTPKEEIVSGKWIETPYIS